MNNKNFIPSLSIEKMAAFLDGNLEAQDMADVKMRISVDKDLSAVVNQANDIDDCFHINEGSPSTEYPADSVIDNYEIPDVDGYMGSQYDEIFVHETRPTFGQLTPEEIQQKYPDTCAIKSQQIILESHDIHITEDQLVQESIKHGWYEHNEGTAPYHVGDLLEDHGMHVTRYIHGSFEDIASELAAGHHVMVGVDSGELWKPGIGESVEDFFSPKGADHALIVSGIQINPLTAEQEVVLTDPGTGEVMHTYTVEQFMDAWNDSDNFMVVAEQFR